MRVLIVVSLLALVGCTQREYDPENVRICIDSTLTHPEYLCWEE